MTSNVYVVYDMEYVDWKDLNSLPNHFKSLESVAKSEAVVVTDVDQIDQVLGPVLDDDDGYVFCHADHEKLATCQWLRDNVDADCLLGCGYDYQSMCLKKSSMMKAFMDQGILTPPTVFVKAGRPQATAELQAQLEAIVDGRPVKDLFVKPDYGFDGAHMKRVKFTQPDQLASSVVAAVAELTDAAAAAAAAAATTSSSSAAADDSSSVLFAVQPFLSGREWTVAVVLGRAYAPVEALFGRKQSAGEPAPDDRSALRKNEDFSTELTAPGLAHRLRLLAEAAYKAVGGDSYGRVDIRQCAETGQLYVLEVNCCCSLTKDSLFQFSLAPDGLTVTDFCRLLILDKEGLLPPFCPKHVSPKLLAGGADGSFDDDGLLLSRLDEYSDLTAGTPAFRSILEQENAFARERLRHTSLLQQTLRVEMEKAESAALDEDPQRAAPRLGKRVGQYVYFQRRTDQGSTLHFRTPFPVGSGDEELVFNEQEWAEGEDFFTVGSVQVSPDHRYVAFTVDTVGSESFELYVRDTWNRTDPMRPECIERVGWNVRFWDDRSFVYVALDPDTGRARSLRWHCLLADDDDDATAAAADAVATAGHTSGVSGGSVQPRLRSSVTDPAFVSGDQDLVVFDEPDERFYLMVEESSDQRYLILTVRGQVMNELWLARRPDSDGEAAGPPVFRLLKRRADDVYWQLDTHQDQRLFALTNANDAVNNHVLQFSVDQSAFRPAVAGAPADTVPTVVAADDAGIVRVAHRSDVFIERVHVMRHHLIVWEWHTGAVQKIQIVDLSTDQRHYVQLGDDLPKTVSLLPGINYHLDYDLEDPITLDHYSTQMRFTACSAVRPTQFLSYDLDERSLFVIGEQPVLGFNPLAYAEEQLYVPVVEDDETVSVCVVLAYKKSLLKRGGSSGGNPLFLRGYGAYGDLSRLSFEPASLTLMDRGVILGWAFVRGDGHLGAQAYAAGRRLNKRNSMLDFWTVIEYLIREGWTSAGRVAVGGRSAGGILIGATVNRPDAHKLIACAVMDVPFLDVLGTMSDPSLPWTVFEYAEWGCPDKKDVRRVIGEYSPYQNVQRKRYPPLLLTAGINDSRVQLHEPLKFVQRVRDRSTGLGLFNSSVLLRTYNAGHLPVASNTNDLHDEQAFKYAFLLDNLLGKGSKKDGPSSQLVRQQLLEQQHQFLQQQQHQQQEQHHHQQHLLSLGSLDSLLLVLDSAPLVRCAIQVAVQIELFDHLLQYPGQHPITVVCLGLRVDRRMLEAVLALLWSVGLIVPVTVAVDEGTASATASALAGKNEADKQQPFAPHIHWIFDDTIGYLLSPVAQQYFSSAEPQLQFLLSAKQGDVSSPAAAAGGTVSVDRLKKALTERVRRSVQSTNVDFYQARPSPQQIQFNETLTGPVAAGHLNAWLSRRRAFNILEIGGTGTLAQAIVQSCRGTRLPRVTLCDSCIRGVDDPGNGEYDDGNDDSDAAAAAAATADQQRGTIRRLPGQMFTASFEGPYDVICISHVLTWLSPPDALSLMRRVSAALSVNGRIVIVDHVFTSEPSVACATVHLRARLHRRHDAGVKPLAFYQHMFASVLGLRSPDFLPGPAGLTVLVSGSSLQTRT